MAIEKKEVIEQNESHTDTAESQNQFNDEQKAKGDETTKKEEIETEKKVEKSEIEMLKETNQRLIKALNDATLKKLLANAKINGNKEEWVRRINADLINDNELIDEAKLGERLASDDYNEIRVFNGLETKTTMNSVYSGGEKIGDNPKVDLKNPLGNKTPNEEGKEIIGSIKKKINIDKQNVETKLNNLKKN